MATQWRPNTIASHSSGDRLGSASNSVMASASETRTAPPRAVRGSSHASGMTQAMYHGSRTGEISIDSRLAQPIAPTTTRGSSRSGSRARCRTTATRTQANSRGKASRTTSEATS